MNLGVWWWLLGDSKYCVQASGRCVVGCLRLRGGRCPSTIAQCALTGSAIGSPRGRCC
ncbi:hypothetical protein PF010_g30187 [Phytophthora fragariae]|uniref:Uncharacterized protein n=1 Tax=Phytophthora fragariae TaxID=53985 RepID=A0A6A3GB94_9STRA|nr:hypothetical protein PF003_g24943 [Phytophthora fragariae]KAE8890985.1 hypothetical protein PF003_g24945 [Phytophthora fragariae]KAE8917115.1 hypothetical protein PF009_g32564 [Phytophthora fragariae]KAE8954602.1 hypothetical protein PF011_g32052 [Phytophthora fragariae]KAE9055942.1 hypothetical protein PF007_g32149 [Phytophthora fragariae]